MDDQISRKAAIDALDGEITVTGRANAEAVRGYANLVCDRIKGLPSAQPEQRWIPCSERLPENGHYYLWCSDMGNVQSDYYWNGFENGMKYGYNIAAWMPLPKPYKEEQE